MSDDTEWNELIRGVSEGMRGVEDAATKMEQALSACDRFLKRATCGYVNEDVLNGLQVGLGFGEVEEWLLKTPATLEHVRQRLVAHDEKVSTGELPATAHTWRYQVQERVVALEERVQRLEHDFAERRAALGRLLSTR